MVSIVFTLLTVVAQGSTDVGGIISEDTTWSLDGSPYNIISDVHIAYGATLTVDPAVEVNNGSVYVFGVLDAEGDPNSKIVFNNVSIKGGDNSPDELYNIILRFCWIKGGYLYSPTGNSIYGGLTITDSFIQDTNSFVYLWYPNFDCHIERNVFYNAGGFSTGTSGVKVYFRNNIFCKQKSGYAVENWANYGGNDIIVEYNSFLSQDRIALKLPSGYDSTYISAPNNYWGTTETSIIDSMIYDKNDDLACADYIDYLPILTEPNQTTYELRDLWGRNDRIIFAEEILPGQTIQGSTNNATGTDVTSHGQDDMYDHWFIFTPTGSADYTVSLCGSSFDTTLAIFDGSVNNELAYNDDFCDYQSQLTYNFQLGQMYYIRVAGFKKQKGDYQLSIDDPLICAHRPASDLNNDCKVNLLDLAMLASEWLDCGFNHPEACQ